MSALTVDHVHTLADGAVRRQNAGQRLAAKRLARQAVEAATLIPPKLRDAKVAAIAEIPFAEIRSEVFDR